MSKNYPQNYSNSQNCTIEGQGEVTKKSNILKYSSLPDQPLMSWFCG